MHPTPHQGGVPQIGPISTVDGNAFKPLLTRPLGPTYDL